jgi:uridylate kinase
MLRVLLKISGEYFGGKKGSGFDVTAIDRIAKQIVAIHDKGVQIAIILGGGNFFRGATEADIDRKAGDNIGMLATVMNALYLQANLEKKKKKIRLMTAIAMNQVADPYITRKAIRHLEKGRIIILGAGLGVPHFSTDTASVVRAKELNADLVIKGTKVDGVFNKDPKQFSDAKKIPFITYNEIIKKNLVFMDSTAITFAKEQQLPIYVLNITSDNELINFFEKKYTGSSIYLQENKDIVKNILEKIND